MERKTLKVINGVRNLRQQLFKELSQGEKISSQKSEVIGRVGDAKEMSTLPKTDPWLMVS